VNANPAERPVHGYDASRPVGAKFAVGRQQARRQRSRGRRRTGPYTREQITAAILSWSAQFGAPPTTTDWEPPRATRLGHEWRAERFYSGEWPTTNVVQARFGSLNAAVAAAGRTPRRAPVRVRANLSGPTAITDSFVAWTKRYGDLPTMANGDPARARRLGQDWRIARYLQGDWPSARSVAKHFGSFANAAAAAGLMPRAAGTQHDDRASERLHNRHAVAWISASGRDPGAEDLAQSLRTLAAARRASDPVAVHAALIGIAGSALSWAGPVSA
jgi:hypothetical protein